MRNKWLGENIPGAVLTTVVRFDDADIDGTFSGSDSFRDGGGDHTVAVKAHFTDAQTQTLSNITRGQQLYIRGTIVHMTDGEIELADFTFRRPINTTVDMGGGTIPLSPNVTRRSNQ
jgi:hypothetical protein